MLIKYTITTNLILINVRNYNYYFLMKHYVEDKKKVTLLDTEINCPLA